MRSLEARMANTVVSRYRVEKDSNANGSVVYVVVVLEDSCSCSVAAELDIDWGIPFYCKVLLSVRH